MSAERLARLRALEEASEARWRALAPGEAARFVYHLKRLRMALAARAGGRGDGTAADRCSGKRP